MRPLLALCSVTQIHARIKGIRMQTNSAMTDKDVKYNRGILFCGNLVLIPLVIQWKSSPFKRTLYQIISDKTELMTEVYLDLFMSTNIKHFNSIVTLYKVDKCNKRGKVWNIDFRHSLFCKFLSKCSFIPNVYEKVWPYMVSISKAAYYIAFVCSIPIYARLFVHWMIYLLIIFYKLLIINLLVCTSYSKKNRCIFCQIYSSNVRLCSLF